MENTTVIEPASKLLDFKLKEIWRYRDLLWLFVKRDIVVVYKQTILGPLWYILQPILTTIMFSFVFGKLANISTGGLPHILFYLLGVTFWGYFSSCLNSTSNIFVKNQGMFGKVYFPRSIVPLSLVISNLGKFLIQLLVFLVIWIYYLHENLITPNYFLILLLPITVIILAITSLGFGMIFSSLTTKYRDLTFLLTFGVQLWMYITPVIYPVSTIPEKYQGYVMLNPISPTIEIMRSAFLGKGTISFYYFGISASSSLVIFLFGYIIFTKVERNFMDTV